MVPENKGEDESSTGKANVTVLGKVEKTIPALGDQTPEKVEIRIEAAEELYREVRIENTMTGATGNPVKLKKGAEVENFPENSQISKSRRPSAPAWEWSDSCRGLKTMGIIYEGSELRSCGGQHLLLARVPAGRRRMPATDR